ILDVTDSAKPLQYCFSDNNSLKYADSGVSISWDNRIWGDDVKNLGIASSNNGLRLDTFGNVHGVYAPGGVHLRPELLGIHQEYVKQKLNCNDSKPLFLVFHGGSGSSLEEFQTAIKFGVVKINIDTDTQYSFLEGIRDYILSKKDYLMSQVGNPEGKYKPNKKFFDPRVWVREGEKSMSKRVEIALSNFGTKNTL
ncbi:unnamed protein product, partial [Pneumocystis jirovecii]